MDENIMIRDMAKDERPREKLLLYGVDSLSNEELLAIVIRTGVGNKSALDLSRILLSRQEEGIVGLTQQTIEELTQTQGIGTTKACSVLAAMELGRRVYKSHSIKRRRITSPNEIIDAFMAQMRFLLKEEFRVIFLNTKNEMVGWETISIGSLNASIVHPREVFNRAVKRSAASLILLHNHPSGNPEPSHEDVQITSRLVEAGKVLGITILDHVIIGDGRWHSMKEHAQM